RHASPLRPTITSLFSKCSYNGRGVPQYIPFPIVFTAFPKAPGNKPGATGVLDIIKDGTLYLAAGVEAGAALIIALAAIQAVARTLLLFARLGPNVQAKENVRLSFAGWLALALEFDLAADILRTAVAPT